MERSASQEELLRDILGSSRRVVLLRGPAGCGKTSIAMGMYRRFRDAAGRSGCCLLLPNDAAVKRSTRQLMEQAHAKVLLAPHVLTFATLAKKILTAGLHHARSITAFQRYRLLRGIVDELNGAGKLHALGGVADTPGLISALDRAISELKRAAVDPADLARAVGETRGKSGDLLKVYQQYQDRLREKKTYDLEGLMWLTRDRLREAMSTSGGRTGAERLEAVVVDGFTDLNPTQLEILVLLSRRLKHVLVTLPLPDADDGRDRMWRWTNRTREKLIEAFGGELEEIVLPSADAPAGTDGSLGGLWERLFTYDAPAVNPPKGLEIIAASGIESEVSAVARRVKRLLIAGAQPGSIAVLARPMNAYRRTIEQVFREFEVPVPADSMPLTDVPIVKFVLDVAGLGRSESGDVRAAFEFQRVLGVIGNSYFRPQALGDFDAVTVAGSEMIIREGNVLSGRSAYPAAGGRLAKRTQQRQENEDSEPSVPVQAWAEPANIHAAVAMLDQLFDLSTAAEGSAGLSPIIESLDLRRAATQQDDVRLIARDLRALDVLSEALVEVDEPSAAPSDIEHLREALGQINLPPPRGETMLDVLDVLDARGGRWDHVFLLGCGEGQFPLRLSDSSLLTEVDRRAWGERGVSLDRRSDLTAREMLLFYLAVSRADHTLTLSYLESDTSGKGSAPGSFLQSLAESLGGLDALRKGGVFTNLPPGSFVFPPGQLASPNEALRTAVAGLFGNQHTPSPEALGWSAENLRPMLTRVAGGLWALHRRWRAGPFNEFDGRLSDPVLRKLLERRIPGETVFSASQLSTFGQCPWRFFAKYLLHLEPLAVPERQIEAVWRGLFCHNVLQAALSDLARTLSRPLQLSDVDEKMLLSAFERAFEEETARVESRQPAYPGLWELQREQMRGQLREYLLGQRNDEMFAVQCLYFELGFGMENRPADRMDPESSPSPVCIETTAGTIRLRGKIDRVDRVKFADKSGLMIVDYKTGRMPKLQECIDGRNTQIPLYIEAIGKLLGETPLGGAFHSVTGKRPLFFATIKPLRGKLAEVKDFPHQQREAMRTIGRFVEQMRGGRFDLSPAAPSTETCRYCPYRRACCYSPSRSEIRGETEEAT